METEPLPLRMTENEFEYCWTYVAGQMHYACVIKPVVERSAFDLAFMRRCFHDIWVDGVMRNMMNPCHGVTFGLGSGADGEWLVVRSDFVGDAVVTAMVREYNHRIGDFLREHMERRTCAVCREKLGTADPDAVACRGTYKHFELVGREFAHAKCCDVVTTGEFVPKMNGTWVTNRDLSPREIVLP